MKSRNLSEAALKLGVSEAAVSKTLRLIERVLGLKLFTLEGGRLRSTAAAREWLPHAQRATYQLDAAVDIAAAIRSGKARPLVIAANAATFVSILPKALNQYLEETPEAQVDLRFEGPQEVLALVAQQEADIGVTNQLLPQFQNNMDLYTRRTISEDLLVAALPKRHRLVANSVVRPDDLKNERLIALPDDSPTTILIEATFRDAGVALLTPVITQNSLSVCALVQEGVGIGLINPLILHTHLFPDLVIRPFRPRIVLWTEIYYSSVRPLTPDGERFVKHLEQVAAAR